MHPIGKLSVLTDFYLQSFLKKSSFMIWVPRLLSIILLFVLTVYTIYAFLPNISELTNNLFFYFLPSLFIFVTIFVSWKHQRLAGLLFTLLGVLLLFPYQVRVGVIVYLTLVITGLMFISYSKENFHYNSRIRTAKK